MAQTDDISHAFEAAILNRIRSPHMIAPLRHILPPEGKNLSRPCRSQIHAQATAILQTYKCIIEEAAAPSDISSSRSRLRRFLNLLRYKREALSRVWFRTKSVTTWVGTCSNGTEQISPKGDKRKFSFENPRSEVFVNTLVVVNTFVNTMRPKPHALCRDSDISRLDSTLQFL